MVERERDTVVVEGDRRNSSYGWLIALIVIAVLIILFFVFGGANMFNGGSTETINVDAPENVQVQPSTQP